MTTLALIAHMPLASALSECAQHVLGQIDNYVFFDIEPDVEPENKVQEIVEKLKPMLGPDRQVLILSDLGGATPANIGARVVRELQNAGVKAHILSGTNACMLLNAVRYREQPMDQLCQSIFEGGKKGMKCVDLAPND